MCRHSCTFAPVLGLHKVTYPAGLSIVIPVYNEVESIPSLVAAVNAYLEVSSMPAHVIFVNDGSSDGSAALLDTHCDDHPKLSVLHFKKNAGLSAAIKAGFDQATHEWVGYMDADLQTTPMDFDLLWQHRVGHGLVTGIRQKRQDAGLKRFSSWFANAFRRMFTKDGIADTGCPLKIIRTDVAKRIPMFKGLHRFLPAMVMLQNETVHQIQVRHFPREAGQSKFHVSNRLFGPLLDCFAYLWMKRKYINYEIADNE